MNIKLSRIASLVLACALPLGAAHAQPGTPAKGAAVKSGPVNEDAKRRGKGDRLLTRDELRACMRLKERNEAGTTEIERRQAQLDQEREALASAPDGSAAARAAVDEKLNAVKQADAAWAAYGKKVEDWNARMAEFEARAKDMRNADRRREVLRQEQVALKADEQKFAAERDAAVAAYEASVKEANAKLAQGSQAQGKAEWNKKSAALAADEQALVAARRKWTTECGERRFREDDETAIKAGK
jgi:chromosome segregation ATPase